MSDLSRDHVVRRLAAELLDLLRSTKRPPAPASKPSSWQRVATALEAARKVTVNLVIILIGGILIAVTGKAAFEPQIVFEPIQVPARLADHGHGGGVLAERMIDRMHKITQQSSTMKERMSFDSKPRYEALSAVQVPSSTLSLRSVVLLLRDLVPTDDVRVAGDLTIMPSQTSTRYVLRLRLDRAGKRQSEPLEDTDLERLIDSAARKILEMSDPYVLALHYYEQDEWTETSRIIDQILHSDPRSSNARWAINLLGLRLKKLGWYDEAIEYFERVAKLDLDAETSIYERIVGSPRIRHRAIPYLNWGNTLSDKKDFDGAIEMYERATELDPRYATLFNSWGNALYGKKNFDGAIDKYRRATELDPKDAMPLNGWGSALYGKKDFDGAIEKYKRATELDPKDAIALNGWGSALYGKKDFDGAIKKYKRAAELNPKDAVPVRNWGLTLKAKGDTDGAEEMFRRADKLEK